MGHNLHLLARRSRIHILVTGSTQELKGTQWLTLAFLDGFSAGILRSAFRLAIASFGSVSRAQRASIRNQQEVQEKKRWGETHPKDEYIFDRRIAGARALMPRARIVDSMEKTALKMNENNIALHLKIANSYHDPWPQTKTTVDATGSAHIRHV